MILLISFFLLLTGGICAQQATTGVLTLKEAEQRFLERNLSLIAERYNIDMAQAQVLQAKLFENPVISLEQNVYNRLNGKYFDFGKEGEMVVGIEQVIRLAGQRNKQVKLEKINKEIADKLNISLTTVISHRKNITEKLGIKSVAGLTIYAVMHGYVEADRI
mgnify:FL=1